MNIIQQSEMLKDISDDRIKQEMQQPTGQFPLYLVTSEAKRRSDMRQRFKAEADGPPPTSTVQQDLMASLAAQTQAPGLPQGQGNQGIMGQQPSPSGPTNIQPTQQFAGGGQVRGFQEGGRTRLTPPEEYQPGVDPQFNYFTPRGPNVVERGESTSVNGGGNFDRAMGAFGNQSGIGGVLSRLLEPQLRAQYEAQNPGSRTPASAPPSGRTMNTPPPGYRPGVDEEFKYFAGGGQVRGFNTGGLSIVDRIQRVRDRANPNYPGRSFVMPTDADVDGATRNAVRSSDVAEKAALLARYRDLVRRLDAEKATTPRMPGESPMEARRRQIAEQATKPRVPGDTLSLAERVANNKERALHPPAPVSEFEEDAAMRALVVGGGGEFDVPVRTGGGMGDGSEFEDFNRNMGQGIGAAAQQIAAQGRNVPAAPGGVTNGVVQVRKPTPQAQAQAQAQQQAAAAAADPYSFKDATNAKYKELSGQDDPYSAIADKLKTHEASLEGAEDKNFWMSVARAGFGAAAGTSQYAGKNLADGGIGGLDAYVSGDARIDAKRDKLLGLETGLAKDRVALDQSYRSLANQAAQGELAGQKFNADNARHLRTEAATAEQRNFENVFSVSKLNAMLRDKSIGRDFDGRLKRESFEVQKHIANLPPALIRSYEHIANMPEGKDRDKLMGILDGSTKRDANSTVKSANTFSKIYQKFVQDNGAPKTSEDWKTLRETFAADPNARLFDVFAAGVRGSMGGSKPRGSVKNGKYVRP
jgi:hypothetical protein